MESKANAKNFIALMKSKLEGTNLNDVLNMDQMPILFLYHSYMMLKVEGSRTVHPRASTTETNMSLLL